MAKDAPSGPNALVLDRTDRRLLQALQEDARRSDGELAVEVNLSTSGLRKRRRKLEDAGIIRSYVVLLDQARVGLPEDVFVVVKLRSNQHDALAAFDNAVKGVDQVMDCHGVTGEWDYLLRVVTRDLHDHDRLCESKLTRLPGVERLESFPTMRRVVGKTSLPLRP